MMIKIVKTSLNGYPFSQKYKLKSLGYGFDNVIERVSEIFQMEKGYITASGRQN